MNSVMGSDLVLKLFLPKKVLEGPMNSAQDLLKNAWMQTLYPNSH